MFRISPIHAARLLVCSLLSCCALASCNKPEAPAKDAAASHEVHQYTVRARVTAFPDPKNPMSEFSAHHEMIPDFRGQNGEIGMKAMVMPFPLAEDFSFDGLEIGDKIALTFTVDYDPTEDRLLAYRATRWEKLPADTELHLTAAAPAE